MCEKKLPLGRHWSPAYPHTTIGGEIFGMNPASQIKTCLQGNPFLQDSFRILPGNLFFQPIHAKAFQTSMHD
jgi:hypothetical protein